SSNHFKENLINVFALLETTQRIYITHISAHSYLGTLISRHTHISAHNAAPALAHFVPDFSATQAIRYSGSLKDKTRLKFLDYRSL
ncbi:MAG: hypothetical protein AAGL17_22545, partial [Cyanobacteria bacterium J06576_12]